MNELARGPGSEATHRFIETLSRPLPAVCSDDRPTIQIFGTNLEVDFANAEQLAQIDLPLQTYTAMDAGDAKALNTISGMQFV